MSGFDDKIDDLSKRLDDLLKSQDFVREEIGQIKNELTALQAAHQNPEIDLPLEARKKIEKKEVRPASFEKTDKSAREEIRGKLQEEEHFSTQSRVEQNFETEIRPPKPSPAKTSRSNLERFIGENLISKIGIVVLILGVAIGAKYAIDKDLISPLTRIIIGYGFGFGLLGFAYKLREKYLNFSSVLLSGAMAIMYFITFFAHSLYGIFGQSAAFILMLVFTVFTVAAAISFNRQVIANIGLVGAYAIPFLVSTDTGNAAFLFSYVAIINIGILAISLKKYWKSLFYLSFIFTWLIFAVWYLFRFEQATHFNLALLFLTINFFTFYLTFIAYKLISDRPAAAETVLLVLANSLIFYGLGYSIFDSRGGFENYKGLFTVANAALHFAFAFAASRLKNASPDLVYLLTALVLTYLTIAVPVQFDGQFVTLVWTAEAAVLFWIGRTKNISLYEYSSLPVMFLAFLSLLADWTSYFKYETADELLANVRPFYNGIFLTSIIFSIAFLFIFSVNREKKQDSAAGSKFRELLGSAVCTVALIVLYNAFRLEISSYFHIKYLFSAIPITQSNSPNVFLFNDDLRIFSFIWQLNFTMLFMAIFSFVNVNKFKDRLSGLVSIFLDFFTLTVFLTAGLFLLGELRESYLYADIFERGSMYIFIRYICYGLVAGLVYAIFKLLNGNYLPLTPARRVLIFDLVLFLTLLFILTAELITWTKIFGYSDSYKLGTSIFWGIYSVGLILLGIYKNKKHLRIGAIALFAVTLAKLFFYDIAELGTISKTIVLVSLGILLLIASFLYNKYKALIFETS